MPRQPSPTAEKSAYGKPNIVTRFVRGVSNKFRGNQSSSSSKKAGPSVDPIPVPGPSTQKPPSGDDDFEFSLPLEILINICRFLESPALYNLALGNKNSYKVAVIMLYRKVTLSNPNRAIKLYETMLTNPMLAGFMREFSIHTPTVDIYAELHAAAIVSRFVPGFKPNQSTLKLRAMALKNAPALESLDMTMSSLGGTGKSEESRARLAEHYQFLLQDPVKLKRLRIRDANSNRSMDEDWMKILMQILVRHKTLRAIWLPYNFPADIANTLKDHLPDLQEVASTSKEQGIEQIIPGRAIASVRLGCRPDVLPDVMPIVKQSTLVITGLEWSPYVDPKTSLELEAAFKTLGENFPYLGRFTTQLKMVRWHEGDVRGEFDIKKWINALISQLRFLTYLSTDVSGGDGSFELDFVDLARPREVIHWYGICKTINTILHDGVFYIRTNEGALDVFSTPYNLDSPGPGPFRRDIKLAPIDLASMPFEVPASVIALLNNPTDRRVMEETVMPLLAAMNRTAS